ncbi:sodium:solute symporter [Streptomyces sp. NPDC059928]|uniref:sodium:solute symporter family protein n=1 Tax=unclassified Streptomyces TaxID=2593676 RepID=UPI00364CE69D
MGALVAAWSLARGSDPRELPHPSGWSLARRGLGPAATSVLLGGTIYTAYTLFAVPGLAYATGGFSLYTLVYTLLLTPAAIVLLPLLRGIAGRHGLVTAADFARARHGSHALSLAIALTGLLATMPYLALQVVGLEAALRVMGASPRSPQGLVCIVLIFALLITVYLPGGLRACVHVASFKAVLIGAGLVVALVLVARHVGRPGRVFALASEGLADHRLETVIPPGSYSAYITLAAGSVLAQLMYPQVLTVALAARSSDTLRRSVLALPLWTLVLGLFTYLGLAALAFGVRTPLGHAELAVPMLLQQLAEPWLTGLLLGALVMGALLPAAVMSIGMAKLVARNVYTEYFNPTATPKHEVRVAQFAAPVITLGALVFALLLPPQDAINLHLLGGVWMIQTFPAVGLAPFTRWFHHRALLAGWAAGMAAGTAMTVARGFGTVVVVGVGSLHLTLYAAVAALVVNLAVAAALTPLLDRLGIARGPDSLATNSVLTRRGSRFAVHVD